MQWCLGFLLATACLGSSSFKPARELFISRANMFARMVEFRWRGRSPEIVSRVLGNLNSLFTTVAYSSRSNWFLNDFAHRLGRSHYFFDIDEFDDKMKPHYFFLSDPEAPEDRDISNFGIDVLVFANVNVLTEITGGWMDDAFRQQLMGRLLSIASRVGTGKHQLELLYKKFDKLENTELEQRVSELEGEVRLFMESADPRDLAPVDLFSKFAAQFRVATYSHAIQEIFSPDELTEHKTILTEIALSVTTEARIGIVPFLMMYIESIVHTDGIDDTDSPQFIIAKTFVQVMARIANSSSRYSMVSLVEFIHAYSLRSWRSPFIERGPGVFVYFLALEIFSDFGIKLLEEYPAMAESVGWSAAKTRACQSLIIHSVAFGLPARDFCLVRRPLEYHALIVEANDEKLINAAHVVARLFRAHSLLQTQIGIFVEPLVDPAVWLEEYLKSSGPSRYAMWVVHVHPKLSIAYPNSHTPLIGVLSEHILEFTGSPRRFSDMSRKISFIHENYQDIERRYGDSIAGIPGAIMKKEVDWDMIEDTVTGDARHIRDLIEGTANIIFDNLRLSVEKPDLDLLNDALRRKLSFCLTALEAVLRRDSLPELLWMEMIHTESGQLRTALINDMENL